LETKFFHYKYPFELESGKRLPELTIAYTTQGKLNAAQDNIVWICHALTANADPADWWKGLIGHDYLIDPSRYFIVCANVLGSCYGTTGPASVNPRTGQPYYDSFPEITIRDMVGAHELLRKFLGIEKIHLCIGGSLGGQQALEWAIMRPALFENLALLATNARHSAWGIAFNESQRMAIKADPSWNEARPDAGQAGLAAARSVALLSYRNYDTYVNTQTDIELDLADHFRASSYQQYQGQKLVKRFNVISYLRLSKAMDSHNAGRNRPSVQRALSSIQAKTLVIGISSDLLFPPIEQVFLYRHIPFAEYEEINSAYGHDGFLVETTKISAILQRFLNCQQHEEVYAL
jgi:homoserine O-acetyltransferase